MSGAEYLMLDMLMVKEAEEIQAAAQKAEAEILAVVESKIN